VRTYLRGLIIPRLGHPDLKSENVLILHRRYRIYYSVPARHIASNPASPPTKLVGIPPSKGRWGNETRSESVHSSIFCIGLESDVGQTGVWEEPGFGGQW
jgi:hypothetical protein